MEPLAKYIKDERTGLEYELCGDYYIITGEDEPEREPIGVWGQRHLNYIQKHCKPFYNKMLNEHTLYDYLLQLNHDAAIKNITLENIRSTSTTMNYLDCIEGEISNVNIRNVEIDYFDRAIVMPESELAYRGNHLLSFKKATGVTLDGITLRGTLHQVTEPIKIVDSEDFNKRNCNF